MNANSTRVQTGVVVTGGASGIGRACANALAEIGRPVAIWDLDKARCQSIADEIATRFEVPAVGVSIDLSSIAGIEDAVDVTRRALPSIGGLVHAAGVTLAVPLSAMEEAHWDGVINVNLKALPFLVKALRSELSACFGSAIVAIASINGTMGSAAVPAYSASKGGVLALVRSLADDLASDNIRINSVSPGYIRTPMMEPSLQQVTPGFYDFPVMLGRMGDPEEIALCVRFLLSDEASYVTAAELVVDGGRMVSQRMR